MQRVKRGDAGGWAGPVSTTAQAGSNARDDPSYSRRDEPTEANFTDEQLMAAYAGGSVEAFEDLFSRYRHRVYGYFARAFADGPRAADLFQETFLKLHRARHRYDPVRPFATWLFAIAANVRRDALKSLGRRPGDEPGDEPSPEPANPATPERLLLAGERQRKVSTALARLPEGQREVVLLHRIEGLSFPEIADALGYRLEAVKSRAFRGYRALRRLLVEEVEP